MGVVRERGPRGEAAAVPSPAAAAADDARRSRGRGLARRRRLSPKLLLLPLPSSVAGSSLSFGETGEVEEVPGGGEEVTVVVSEVVFGVGGGGSRSGGGLALVLVARAVFFLRREVKRSRARSSFFFPFSSERRSEGLLLLLLLPLFLSLSPHRLSTVAAEDLCDAYIPSMKARAAAAARRVSALGEGREGGIGVFPSPFCSMAVSLSWLFASLVSFGPSSASLVSARAESDDRSLLGSPGGNEGRKEEEQTGESRQRENPAEKVERRRKNEKSELSLSRAAVSENLDLSPSSPFSLSPRNFTPPLPPHPPTPPPLII